MKKIFFLILLIAVLLKINEYSLLIKTNAKENILNYLLIGIDDNEEKSRSDVTILISINRNESLVSLISIPRDSLVNVPCGINGSFYDKINHSYVYGNINWGKDGGVNCLVQSVSLIFDIAPMPYVLCTFESLKKLIDEIGGVDVIARHSFEIRNSKKEYLKIKKGKMVHLDGEYALAYIRHRKSLIRQDLDRIDNQKDVLKSCINKINSLSKFSKIKMALKINTLIRNNIPLEDIFNLLKSDFAKLKYNSYTLKGSDYYNSGYYYKLDKEYIKYIRKHVLT